MKLFFLAALVDRGEEHAAGVDAHHGTRRQVGDGDQRLAHQLLGLVIGVDAGEDGAGRTGAIVQCKLQQLLGLFHSLARQHLHGTEIALGEGLEIHEVREQRLDGHVAEVDLLLYQILLIYLQ